MTKAVMKSPLLHIVKNNKLVLNNPFMRLMLPFLVIAFIAHFYPHPIVPICLENEVLRRQKYMQIEYENKICVSGNPQN